MPNDQSKSSKSMRFLVFGVLLLLLLVTWSLFSLVYFDTDFQAKFRTEFQHVKADLAHLEKMRINESNPSSNRR